MLFLGFILIMESVCSVHAETVSWNNSSGGSWNISSNWSPAKVPITGDDVLISDSEPISFNTTATIKTLKLKSARLAVSTDIVN